MMTLKTCPFCGQKPIVYAIGPHEHIVVDLPKFGGGYIVECPLCNVGFAGETMEDVLYDWNRRPDGCHNGNTRWEWRGVQKEESDDGKE